MYGNCLEPPPTFVLITFSDFSNFLQFLEKSQKLQKWQFLLGTLLPPLPLEFRNFSKNCDFSNFSQFLLYTACKLEHISMHEALKERPVKGTTAAVAILDESSKILEVQKIKQFSELHNFRYEESGIRVWKAYAVGVGKLIPWQSLYIRHQGCTNISLMEGKGFFTNTEIRDLHRPRKCQATKDDFEIKISHRCLCALNKAVIALLTLSPNLSCIHRMQIWRTSRPARV